MTYLNDSENLTAVISGSTYRLKRFILSSEDASGHDYDCSFYVTEDESIIIKCFQTFLDGQEGTERNKEKYLQYCLYLRGFQNEYTVMQQIQREGKGDLFPLYYDYYPNKCPEDIRFPEDVLNKCLCTWIAMEKIKGPTLEKFLSHLPSAPTENCFQKDLLAPWQRYAIMEQTRRAVRILYDHGLYHLDLNPSNLILEDKAQMRLRFIDITSCKRKDHSACDYPFRIISQQVQSLSRYYKNSSTRVDFTAPFYLEDDRINILLVKCFRELYMRLFYRGKDDFVDATLMELSKENRMTYKNPFLGTFFGSLMNNQFILRKTGHNNHLDRDEYQLDHLRKCGCSDPLFEVWFAELEKMYRTTDWI